ALEGTRTPPTSSPTAYTTLVRSAPQALDDTDATSEDTPVTVAVLANDSDPDGDPLTISSVTQGAHGTVVVNADGTLSYTPDANFNGTDTVSYTVTNADDCTATAS